MGSRSKIDFAYVAGFLDGDGSLMLQLKKRSDSPKKYRFMATVCFYQDSRHKKTLFWIRDLFGVGYVSDRKDGMSELRINGFASVQLVLVKLLPFIKFKITQARALAQACEILNKTTLRTISEKQLRKLVGLILVIQNENYVTKRKKTGTELLKILGLTP